MLVPRHRSPFLGKEIYPIPRVLVTIGNLKSIPLSGFFPRLRQKNTSLSREKWEHAYGPLYIRVGGGGDTDPTDILKSEESKEHLDSIINYGSKKPYWPYDYRTIKGKDGDIEFLSEDIYIVTMI